MLPEVTFIWDAFWDLTSERDTKDGNIGNIPWRAVNDYAYRYRINDTTEFDNFIYLLKRLDNEFVDMKRKEIKRQRDLNNTKQKKPRR